MQKRTRNWVFIVLAVLGVCTVLVVGTIGSVAYFVASHIDTEAATPSSAIDRFADVRQRFAGREPIVSITDNEQAVVRPHDGSTVATPAPRLKNLNVLVYDPDDEQLVEITAPYWLLRLLPTGEFSVRDGGVQIDSARLHLTVDELEKYGPSLVLDHKERRGPEVIVWTE